MKNILEGAKGVGAVRRAALANAGITDSESLLEFRPVGYRDFTRVKPISEITSGDEC